MYISTILQYIHLLGLCTHFVITSVDKQFSTMFFQSLDIHLSLIYRIYYQDHRNVSKCSDLKHIEDLHVYIN